jgi:hypothetical protein
MGAEGENAVVCPEQIPEVEKFIAGALLAVTSIVFVMLLTASVAE